VAAAYQINSCKLLGPYYTCSCHYCCRARIDLLVSSGRSIYDAIVVLQAYRFNLARGLCRCITERVYICVYVCVCVCACVCVGV